MGNLTTLKAQIETANALGRANLNAKGVPTDGKETTYQLMGKIVEVTGGTCDVYHDALRQEGYTEGHAKGYTEGETAGYNTGYTKGETAGYNTGYSAGYTKGYADGQSGGSGEPENVQNPLEYAKSVSFRESTFIPNYEISLNTPALNSLSYAFYNTTGLKEVKLAGNNSGNVVDFSNSFRNSADLESVDLSAFNAKISSGNSAFHTARKLREILGAFDFSECTNVNTMFQNCNALETVELVANLLKMSISFSASPLLSANSIQSIIDGLAKVETKQTLSLHSTTAAKLTDEQYNILSAKNWQIQ